MRQVQPRQREASSLIAFGMPSQWRLSHPCAYSSLYHTSRKRRHTSKISADLRVGKVWREGHKLFEDNHRASRQSEVTATYPTSDYYESKPLKYFGAEELSGCTLYRVYQYRDRPILNAFPSPYFPQPLRTTIAKAPDNLLIFTSWEYKISNS